MSRLTLRGCGRRNTASGAFVSAGRATTCTVTMDAVKTASVSFSLIAVPFTLGDWNGTGATAVGIYRNGTWYLDRNGNGVFDGGATEEITWGGVPGDLPVVGTW